MSGLGFREPAAQLPAVHQGAGMQGGGLDGSAGEAAVGHHHAGVAAVVGHAEQGLTDGLPGDGLACVVLHLDGDALGPADREHIDTEVMRGLGELSAVALSRQQLGHEGLEAEGIEVVHPGQVEPEQRLSLPPLLALPQPPDHAPRHQQRDEHRQRHPGIGHHQQDGKQQQEARGVAAPAAPEGGEQTAAATGHGAAGQGRVDQGGAAQPGERARSANHGQWPESATQAAR